MENLTESEFQMLFEKGVAEGFAGDVYTFINYEDEEFYFYYNAKEETFIDQGEYKLNDDQLKKIAESIYELYQINIEKESELEITFEDEY